MIYIFVLLFGLLSYGINGGAPTVTAPVLTGTTITGASPAVLNAPMHVPGSTAVAVIPNSGGVPTSCNITAGDTSGNFQCVVAGSQVQIQFTANGVSNITGATFKVSQTLTVTATNGIGTSSGVSVPVNVYADGSVGAQTGTASLAGLISSQAAVAINVVGGSGYTAGTGYAWTATSGGCSVEPSGTIDVDTGVNSIASITGGSGYTNGFYAIPATGGGGGGTAIIGLFVSGGVIQSVANGSQILAPGSGYTGTPTVSLASLGAGSGGSVTLSASSGYLTNPVISAQGSGCTSRPTIAIPAGAGAGTGGSIVPSVYQVRPPWLVAGVDYPVGPASGTVYLDPATSLPGCATYSSGAINVVHINSNNCTLNSFDLTLHGGVGVLVANNVTGTTITNSKIIASSSSFQSGGPVVGFNQHFTGEDLTVTYSDINGNCLGNIGIGCGEGGIFLTENTGTFIFKYNRCYNYAQHCVDLSLNSSSTNANTQFLYNTSFNSGTSFGAHGELAYWCGGTFTNVVQDFNTGILALNSAFTIVNSAVFAITADTSCGGTATLTADVSYNVAYAQGTQAVTGSNNNVGQVGAAAFFTGGAGLTATYTEDYIDYSGAFFPYDSSGGSITFSGTLNAPTGNTCTKSSCSFLLKRDIDPASNDNSPMWLDKAA